MSVEPQKPTTAPCNSCLRETKQDVLASKRIPWPPEAEMHGEDVYEMLTCCGCGTVHFRHRYSGEDDMDMEGNVEEHVTYYPPKVSRQKPKWLSGLRAADDELSSLFHEVYNALDADSRVLPAIGVRTILDKVMTTEVGDCGSFAATLAEFEKQGNISQKQREIVEKTIDVGSASAHRGFRPTSEDLNTLLDIAETVVATVIVHPSEMKKVAKRVPRRRKRKKK